MTTEMTIEQIKACIKLNEETYKAAFQTLRDIFNAGTSLPFYTERLVTASDLCSEIAQKREKLEHALWVAMQKEA
jgi:hypothetical protein